MCNLQLFCLHTLFLMSHYRCDVKYVNETCVEEYLEDIGFTVPLPADGEEDVIQNVEVVEAHVNKKPPDVSYFLKRFQRYYHLPVDGKLNKETIALMRKPRCGNKEELLNLKLPALDRPKWNVSKLFWTSTPYDDTELYSLTERAMSVWQPHVPFQMVYGFNKADITILKQTGAHKFSTANKKCWWPFDGSGGILGHAYGPGAYPACEVHMDGSEKWYMGLDGVPTDSSQTSFLSVLIHEIGHTLGLPHSNEPDSLMNAFYGTTGSKLTNKDINDIQELYSSTNNGPASSPPPPPSSSTVIPSSTEKPTIPKQNNTMNNRSETENLCELEEAINTLLIAKQKLYLFHKQWVWVINLISKTLLFQKPLLIRDWMPFLPENFSRLQAIYQRPNGELVVIVGREVYVVEFPSFQLKSGWPRSISEVFHIPAESNIRGAVNTYTGRSYVFYNNNNYLEIDECGLTPVKHGLLSESKIPQRINGVFRFTNGLLYFFKKGTYYEYDEFTVTVKRSGKKVLSELFDVIRCPSAGIINQLKDLLSTLLLKNILPAETYADDDDVDNVEDEKNDEELF